MAQETEGKENNLEKECKPTIAPGIKFRQFHQRGSQTKSPLYVPGKIARCLKEYQDAVRY